MTKIKCIEFFENYLKVLEVQNLKCNVTRDEIADVKRTIRLMKLAYEEGKNDN